MMAVLFCGVALGFVLSTALFIQKIWSANDKAEYYKERAEFFKNEAVKEHKARREWEVCEGSSDLFTKF